MTRADLKQLARRCETEGASRELDAEIWWRVEPRKSGIAFNNAAMGLPRKLDHDAPIPKGMGHAGVMAMAPAYTSSLDAAVSLVPEGWGAKITIPKSREGAAEVFDPATGQEFTQNGEHQDAAGNRMSLLDWSAQFKHAKTPALALCAAALRARAAMQAA